MNNVSLSSIIDIISGGTPDTNNPKYWNGNIGWLSVNDFKNKLRYVYNSEKKITDLGLKNSSTNLLQQGDIIISARGTVGALAQIGLPMCFNQSCFGIRGKKEKVSTDYLYYALKNYTKNIIKRSHGSVFDTINLASFDLMRIQIHDSIAEQHKITKILSDLDKKIELNYEINFDLEAMAKLIYDYWFVQFDFPDENGKPYKSSGGKMVFNEDLKREIPIGWCAGRLSDFEKKIVTGKTPSTKDKNNFGGDIPFICIGDVRGNMYITKTEITLTEVGAASQANKFIPKDAICVTCIASPGLVAFSTSDSQTNQQINSVVCSKKENQYFLYFYLKDYFNFAKAKMGNTFANMNKEDFSSILLPYPKDDIISSFSEKVKSIFDLVLQNSQENNLLTEKRDWLLQLLMNGQVTVSEAS